MDRNDAGRSSLDLELHSFNENVFNESTEAVIKKSDLVIIDDDDDEKGNASLEQQQGGKSREEMNHVTGYRLVVIVVCLMLAIFCVALDNTS